MMSSRMTTIASGSLSETLTLLQEFGVQPPDGDLTEFAISLLKQYGMRFEAVSQTLSSLTDDGELSATTYHQVSLYLAKLSIFYRDKDNSIQIVDRLTTSESTATVEPVLLKLIATALRYKLNGYRP
jgi:hypothetical protein